MLSLGSHGPRTPANQKLSNFFLSFLCNNGERVAVFLDFYVDICSHSKQFPNSQQSTFVACGYQSSLKSPAANIGIRSRFTEAPDESSVSAGRRNLQTAS